MLEKQHQSIAFELIQSSKLDKKKILYFCESDKEARLLKNELLILLDNSMIGYFRKRNSAIRQIFNGRFNYSRQTKAIKFR